MPRKKVVRKRGARKLIDILVCELRTGAKRIKVEEDSTVEEVLHQAGLTVTDKAIKDLRINGDPAKLSDTVEADDIVSLVPQVDGGR